MERSLATLVGRKEARSTSTRTDAFLAFLGYLVKTPVARNLVLDEALALSLLTFTTKRSVRAIDRLCHTMKRQRLWKDKG